MREEKITAHRLAAYSDAVFAVIVTVMVLELRAPDQPAFSALWPLWPTAISYAVSYLFISMGYRRAAAPVRLFVKQRRRGAHQTQACVDRLRAGQCRRINVLQ